VAQAPSRGQGREPVLTSDDLFTIYQAALTGAVQDVTGPQLIRGALKGSRTAAVEAGLLPVESAILDTVSIEDTGNPRADWPAFGRAYDAFTKKLEERAEIAPVGRGAARGMLGLLNDPLSAYLDREAVAAMQAPSDAGVGVVLAPGTAGPVIRELEPDGPADRAGLRPGDVIRTVNGRETTGMEHYQVVAALRGAAGEQVRLSVRSPGSEGAREVPIRRAPVRIAAAAASVEGGVHVIQLRAFDSGATQAIGRALAQTAAAGASGWLLDLRGNGEGSLTEAVGVVSLVVGQRVVALEEDHGGRQSPVRGTLPALPLQLPLVILVDGATAGPGEIVAAAAQDYGVATVVGTTTAGRLGTPRVIGLSDGSAAEIAIRRLLSPSGKALLGSGVTPDLVVADDPAALAAGSDSVRERGLSFLK
jgi:carboxyl-terminal processing protease